MAGFILSQAGSAIGGPAGQFVGAIVGGFVDSQLFAPDTKPIDLSGIRDGAFDEGAPAFWTYGEQCPVAGQVMYVSEVRAEKIDKKDAKDSGPGYNYLVDVVVGWTKNEIESVTKFWFGSQLVYDGDIDTSIIDATDVTGTYEEGVQYINGFGGVIVEKFLLCTAPAGGTDLTSLVSGYNATVSGFTNAAFNGTRMCLASGKNADSSTFARFRIPVSTTASGTSGGTVSFSQNLPELSPQFASSVTFYTGSGTQLPDGFLEAVFGAGNVPAFRGTSYAVIRNLNITKWGANLPKPRGLVKQSTGATVGGALTAIVQRSPYFDGTDIDVTGLTDPFVGISISGPQPPIDALRQVMFMYNIGVQRDGTTLRFFKLTDTVSRVVDAAHLGASENDTARPRPFDCVQPDPRRLPESTLVTFIDPDRDFQPGERSYVFPGTSGTSPRRMSTNVVVTAQTAATQAKVGSWVSHMASDSFFLDLPFDYSQVSEGDLVQVPDGIYDKKVRVGKLDRGESGLNRFECAVEYSDVYNQTVEIEVPPEEITQNSTQLPLPPELAGAIFDLPALTSNQATQIGLTLAAANPDPVSVFAGGSWFRSTDGGTTYTSSSVVSIESFLGFTIGALAGGVDEFALDTATTLTVRMDKVDAQLVSQPAEAVRNGANMLAVGNEVLAFETATLIADRTYELTRLHRGLLGSERFIGTHLSGERMLVLGNAWQFPELNVTDLDTTSFWRLVASGGDVATVPTQSRLVTGQTAKPWAPGGARAVRQAVTDNLTVTFYRRSRVPFRLLAGQTPPNLEPSLAFQIDVLNGSTVVRTITTTTTSFVYTGVDQTADFGSTQTAIDFVIYQVGSLVGRGNPLTVTL